MFDRIKFFKSVNGIQNPDMMVSFFDHFIALKSLVEDKGTVDVIRSDENSIAFSITFSDKGSAITAVNYVASNPRILIYGRFISASVNILTDKKIEIILQ